MVRHGVTSQSAVGNDLLLGYGNMATGTIAKPFIIHSKSISKTTDATGDIDLDLVSTKYMPLAFKKSSPTNAFFSYTFAQASSGSGWWMKCLSDSAGNYASKAIAGTLYYTDI